MVHAGRLCCRWPGMLPTTAVHTHEKHVFYMQLVGMGIAIALLVLFPLLCVPVVIKTQMKSPRRFNTTPIMDSAKNASRYNSLEETVPLLDREAAQKQADRLKAQMTVAYTL